MTREESLQIVQMLLTHWRASKEWTKEEMDVYARLIQDMDAELTTSAVIGLAKEIAYRPHPAQLRERVREERRRLRPVVQPLEPERKPIPFWVKRWICARMLYAKFGKPRDMRRFPEQADFGDLTTEMMPEGAWEAEANSMSDEEFAKSFSIFVR